MRSPPLPLLVLLAITIAANFLVFRAEDVISGDMLTRVLYLALLAAQSGLLASWFTLGATNILLRLTALVAAVVLGWRMLAVDSILERFRFVSIAELILAIALTGVLRFFGFQWTLKPTANATGGLQPRQFALRELLGWTTAIAVIMVVIRQALLQSEAGTSMRLHPMQLILAASFAGLSVLPLALATPRVRIAWRLALALLAAVIVGGLFAMSSPREAWLLMIYFVTAMLIQCMWILTARACGYRLVRSQRRAVVVTQPDIDPWSADAG